MSLAGSTGNTILSNSIFSNGWLGIDLSPWGVTLNDLGDGDTGANNQQNFPVLSLAASSGSSTAIQGTLNSTASTTFTVEFFSSAVADPSGFGEGEFFLGSTSVATDPSGNSSFTVTLPVNVPVGHILTATATDSAGNTSEFSQAVAVTSCSFTVRNTNDSGLDSFREAIDCANATPGVDVIRFRIPGTGPHTISPTSSLPTITDPVEIDGYTQFGASEATASTPATLMVVLDGSNIPGSFVHGLQIDAGSSTVKGLVINRFHDQIHLAGAGGNRIRGNYLGTDTPGAIGLGNTIAGSGVQVFDSASNIIGGVLPRHRNVLSGNRFGVRLDGSNATANLVQGNFIGTDPTGTAGVGNGEGVFFQVSASNNTIVDNLISDNFIGVQFHGQLGAPNANFIGNNLIGTTITGAAPLGNVVGISVLGASNNTIQGNVISGNSQRGVTINDFYFPASGNVLQQNSIGTDSTGTIDLRNGTFGIVIGGSDNVIGAAAAPSLGNKIAFNDAGGVVTFNSGSGNSIHANSIFANGGLGIDLGNDGLTLNDPGDGDAGANERQNFPVLTSALSVGGSTTVTGTFNSTPGTTFRLEFFSSSIADPSGFGEGETFLGSLGSTTDGSGNINFNLTFPTAVPGGHVITATATDPVGNTSEFSQAAAVAACSLTVINTNDSGPGSLRDAIDCSNTTPGTDTIDFNIGGGGAQSIVLGTSSLPSITDPVIIDGSTQPGYAGTPLITIDAAAVTTSDVMRVWTGGGGTTLRDFNVINAASVAVFVGDGAGDNLITNVHASWGGSSAAGTGFWITDSDNNTIREVTATNRVQSVVLRDANDNLVENSYLSGSGVGVVLALASSGNTIQNNVVSGSGFGVRSSSSGSGNRYLSNDLSQSTNYALDIFNESSFVVAGNDFTDSFAGVRLGNMDGLTLSPNPDFDIDVSTASLASYVGALALTNVTNSTISGFDLTSASAAAQGGAGLVVSGGSNNVIEDLTVTDRTWGVYANGGLTDTLFQRVDASWGGAAAAGTGFWITNSDNNTIRSATATNRVQAVVLRDANNNLVENSNLSGSGVGVVLALVSGGNTIHNNDGSGSGFGVRSSSSGSGNQYLSNDFSQSTNYALDIFNETMFVVSGNDFSDSFAGVRLGDMNGLNLSPNPDFDIDVSTASLANYVGALALTDVTNSTISGFDLTSATAAAQGGIGLLIKGGSNNVIEEMTIVDRARGASLVSTSDNTIHCSTFSNNSIGILQSAGSGQVVVNSDISGNGSGITNSSGDLIDAQNNYWGAADGPSNLGGSGDSFTGNVDAAPFRDGLPACLIDDISAGGPYTVDEGNSVQLVASGIPGDPDSGSVQWDFDYDGITFDVDATGLEPLFDASNLDGPTIRTVGVRAADDTGSTNIATTALRIDNVAPTLASLTATTINENGVTTLTGTITDPGTLDTFTLDVDWGDPLSPNDTETYTFGASATGSQTFTLTHQYLDDNPTATPQDDYAVNLSLRDDDMPAGDDSPPETKIVNPDAELFDNYGWDVAISGDLAIVGAESDNALGGDAGAVYVYQRTGGSWMLVKKLVGGDTAAGDRFGRQLAVSGDTIVVGVDRHNSKEGAAYVFERNEGGADNWGQVAKLTDPTPADDLFGSDVAIHGDSIIVGALREHAAPVTPGAAYLFERNQGGADNWGLVKRVVPADLASVNSYGEAVAIQGDTILVGAKGGGNGAAYLFQRDVGGAGNWGEVAKLTASDGAPNDRFGLAVSLDADAAVVGAYWHDAGGLQDAGAAYVYERHAGGANAWGQVAKLTPSDAAVKDWFGRAVSISGNRVVVGTFWKTDLGSSQTGGAYLFDRNQGGAGAWDEVRELVSSDLGPGDSFGRSVSIDGSSVLIGAPGDYGPPTSAGSAYVFNVSGSVPATTASTTVTVKNVAPTLADVSVSSPINENELATLSGTIVDPGSLDTFTLDIGWGDPLSPGNLQSVALGATPINSDGVSWDPDTRQFTVEHQYLDDNPTATPQDTYTISATVSDDDGGTSGTISGVGPQAFSAAIDFSKTVNTEIGTWSYRYRPDTVRNGNYILFDQFNPIGHATWNPGPNPGFWDSGVTFPLVGVNDTGSVQTVGDFSWPAGGMLVHPGPSSLVAVSWLSPVSGPVDIDFLFMGEEDCGNGIAWFVELNNSSETVASGLIPKLGSTGTQMLSAVNVDVGDRINFIVDPNGGFSRLRQS